VRAALFITCLNDSLFPDAGKATVALLERLGVTVDFPQAQTCCGQMHYNTGYQGDAAVLARGFASAFAGYEYVVAPSGSCAAMVREIHPRIVPDAEVPTSAAADGVGRKPAGHEAAGLKPAGQKVYEQIGRASCRERV